MENEKKDSTVRIGTIAFLGISAICMAGGIIKLMSYSSYSAIIGIVMLVIGLLVFNQTR